MKRRTCIQLAAAAVAVPLPAWAQASAPIPIADFVRPVRYRALAISPDGKHLAAIAPVGGRGNVVVLDLEKRSSSAITSLRDQDVGGLAWVNSRRLVFWLGADTQTGLGEQRLGQGLFAINLDASEPKTLSSPNPQLANARNFTFRYAQYASTVREVNGDEQSSDVLVFANDRNQRFPDVYRMDTLTGRKTLLTDRKPGDAILWRADRKLAVRAAVTTADKNKRQSLYWRASADSEWIEQASWATYSGQDILPVGFDGQGQLQVSALYEGRYAIYRWDPARKALGERLIAHKDYDVLDGLVHSPESGALLGVRIDAERLETIWVDEALAATQAVIDRALPGQVNVLTRPSKAAPFLVRSFSDRNPARWYLYDPATRQLEEAVAAAPWLRPSALGERKFMRYTARDGRSIPAYLTLPAGSDGKGLPLVVHVHGGPHLRGETWRYDPEAQFLASRGYAVLQADFRGSKGYGHAHYAAGMKQWGLAMQDDLNDGAAALVAQGVADPKRMAIMGGSYGGYAVMMGLARDPELWRCGINVVGVTSLDLLTNASWSDTAQWDGHEHFFAVHLGDSTAEAARFEATSPIRQAARIKRPVMMAYGAGDQRVPIQHATAMEAALRQTGVPLEYVVYNDEGHGFLREANRTDYFRRVEAFLGKHMA